MNIRAESRPPIEIRDAGRIPLAEIVSLEQTVWPPEVQAGHEVFEHRLARFPNGVIGAYQGERLVGLSTSMRVAWSPDQHITSWEQITDNGRIGNHNEDGNTLYIVSIGAMRLGSQGGAGSALLEGQITLAQTLGARYVVAGSRVPGYRQWSESHGNDIGRYVAQTTVEGLPLDPLLRFYRRHLFVLGTVVPNYMTNDPESGHYGVVVWRDLTIDPLTPSK